MKIHCDCGAYIPDQSDYLVFKARLVPDQDYFDLLDSLENTAATAESIGFFSAVSAHSVMVYQCVSCWRLFVFRGDQAITFSPDVPSSARYVLASVQGEHWKTALRGAWRNGVGTLHWPAAGDGGGYEQGFATWEALQTRYYAVFRDLREKGVLRDSMLRREGKTEHYWPPRETPRTAEAQPLKRWWAIWR